ncbi:SLBB domain-containing protein [Pseudoalteromonas sp. OOF1S-7]|uniref:SLBB domain-containing protein n=1 Tax=Pseudoalteromonas sp. OOF1S-7 TaxID=2917757 RepID=UPI001EF73A10|nr:SLBB domain-containing protein [Pseudoalteromonas sp. OOF1S-7]MCG7536372.1 SLBB domain-containing protein [Pseudoalteromonas sp. OOF1S-7]
MSFKRIFAATMLVFSAVSIAFTPTAQQIAQFKKLPKSQQQALAKQYGINISDLPQSISGGTTPTQSQPSVYPRQEKEPDEATDPLEPREEKLEPFGYSIFSGEPSSFAPSESLSVPNDYVIAGGDSFSVSFYGKETATHNVVVDREGRLNIPGFSPIDAVGLTYAELKSLVTKKIKNEAIGLQAYISIAELRSVQVLVVGEIYRPGSYTLSPLSSATHALFASGGLTEISSLRNIEVKRQGKTISTLDLYDLLLKGDTSSDVVLQTGDVVFVPSVGPQVSVGGLVKRPAIFELKEGDTVEQLVQMFGGFKENAFLQQVQVKRVVNNAEKSVVSVDFREGQNNYQPQGGDKIKVQPVNEQLVGAVSLIGAVARPGYFEWHSGMTVKSLIGNLKTDLLPQADLNYSIIVRESDELGEIEVIQFSLADSLKNSEVVLQKNDAVYVFSRFVSQEEEDNALRDLAMTAQEQELQLSVKLWHMYEQRQFEKKVSFDVAMDKLQNKKRSEQDKDKEELDYTPSVFGREALLAPILAQLEYQSSSMVRTQVVEVSGQVRFPGIYPLIENMPTSKAIQAAGGLLESAYTEFAEVTRVNTNGDVLHMKSSLTAGSDGFTEQKLKSRDIVNVLLQPNWQESFRVELKGEVLFPGTYIVKRDETLQNVIQRAGGLTHYADPRAAIFTREAIKVQERKQLAKLSDELRKDIAAKSFQKSIGTNTSLSYNETNKLLKDLASVEAVGRLVIDLPSVLSNSESLGLQDGDTLYVPGKQDSISIIGEVNYSSSHLFKKGTSIEDYINLSGGLRERADGERIYVIKANGAVFIPNRGSWFAVNDQVDLEAGDTIVVPMDASYMDNLTLWSTATQIFYQLGVGVAAIARI